MAYQIYNLDMIDQQELADHIANGGIIVRYERPYSDYGCLMWASMDDEEIADEAQRAFDNKWGRSVAYPGYKIEKRHEDGRYIAVVEYHGRDTWCEHAWESDRYTGEDGWKVALPEAEAEYERMCADWPESHFTLELLADFDECSESWQTLRDSDQEQEW